MNFPIDIFHKVIHRSTDHETQKRNYIKGACVNAIGKDNVHINESHIEQQVKAPQFEDIIIIDQKQNPQFDEEKYKVQKENQNLVGRCAHAAE